MVPPEPAPPSSSRLRPGSGTLSGGGRLLFLVATLVLLAGCDASRQPFPYLAAELERAFDAPGITENLPDPVDRDWGAIEAGDTLVALLTFNSTSYFIYRGQPMGYEYALLRAFTQDQDLELRTVVVRDPSDLFRMLNRGDGDVVASRLVPIPDWGEHVGFTRPLYETRPVVVQPRDEEDREPRGSDTVSPGGAPSSAEPPVSPGRRYDPATLRVRVIRHPSELTGEAIHLPAGSSYYGSIVELSDTLEGEIEVVEVENAESVEELIGAVARGEIRLTVSQENVAQLTREQFTTIEVQPVIGPLHPVAWAVRSNARELRRRLNRWIGDPENEELLASLYRTYFVDRKGYVTRAQSEFFASETGVISEYDTLLQREAVQIGWDWRLLAAQVFQESRFDPRARSWAGAEGLLQLMPATAREVGVRNPRNPVENVAGGVRYLDWLTDQWSERIPGRDERLKFILASYNAGLGHVQDAQRLAEKHGDNPGNWDDVAYWMLQMSKPRYYRDPVVRYGYVRGTEPVNYVSHIMERFQAYEESVPAGEAAGDTAGPGGSRSPEGAGRRNQNREEEEE